MKTLVLTIAVALLSLSSVAASAYPYYYGHRSHHGYYRHGGNHYTGGHIIGSGDRHGTASGGPVGGFKSQP